MIHRIAVRRALLGAVLSVFVLSTPAAWASEVEKPSEGPLAPFARLIGSQWHLEGTYTTFEWGVGKKSVIGRGYTMVDGSPKIVSEGLYFYHPGDNEIRGYFVAVDMGIDLFDYRITFDGDHMVGDLTCYGAYGGQYEEVWQFTDDDHYEWTLYQKTEEGKTKMMGGTYERR